MLVTVTLHFGFPFTISWFKHGQKSNGYDTECRSNRFNSRWRYRVYFVRYYMILYFRILTWLGTTWFWNLCVLCYCHRNNVEELLFFVTCCHDFILIRIDNRNHLLVYFYKHIFQYIFLNRWSYLLNIL